MQVKMFGKTPQVPILIYMTSSSSKFDIHKINCLSFTKKWKVAILLSWFAAPARLDDIAKIYKHTQKRIELGKSEGERITNKYYICIQVILSKSKSWWRKSTLVQYTQSRMSHYVALFGLMWAGLCRERFRDSFRTLLENSKTSLAPQWD